MDDKHFGEFMGQVHVNARTGCWNWLGSTTEEGEPIFKGKQAKRASRALAGLKDPEPSEVIVHACRRLSCVRPEHLAVLPLERWRATRYSTVPDPVEAHERRLRQISGEEL